MQAGAALTQAKLRQEWRRLLELKAAAVHYHVSRQQSAVCQAHAGLINSCGSAHDVLGLPGARKLEILVVRLACACISQDRPEAFHPISAHLSKVTHTKGSATSACMQALSAQETKVRRTREVHVLGAACGDEVGQATWPVVAARQPGPEERTPPGPGDEGRREERKEEDQPRVWHDPPVGDTLRMLGPPEA